MLKRVLTDHWDGWNRSTWFFIHLGWDVHVTFPASGPAVGGRGGEAGKKAERGVFIPVNEASVQLHAAAAVQFGRFS